MDEKKSYVTKGDHTDFAKKHEQDIDIVAELTRVTKTRFF